MVHWKFVTNAKESIRREKELKKMWGMQKTEVYKSSYISNIKCEQIKQFNQITKAVILDEKARCHCVLKDTTGLKVKRMGKKTNKNKQTKTNIYIYIMLTTAIRKPGQL